MGELLKDIAITTFAFWAAIYGFLFYTGRLKFSDKQKKIRNETVRKYGWVMIIAIIGLVLAGAIKLLITLNKLYIFLAS